MSKFGIDLPDLGPDLGLDPGPDLDLTWTIVILHIAAQFLILSGRCLSQSNTFSSFSISMLMIHLSSQILKKTLYIFRSSS